MRFTFVENGAVVEIVRFLYFYFVLSNLLLIYKDAMDHVQLELQPVRVEKKISSKTNN